MHLTTRSLPASHVRPPAARVRTRPAIATLRASLCATLAIIGATARAADSDTGLTHRPSQLRLGIERVTLPGDEHMGLVGTSYLVGLGQGFSFGPAAYGAISGQRGGLFTIGAELAWRQPLVGPLALDLGYYVGGGGGAAAPVGGGLMLRPHADLSYDLGGHRVGVSYSQVRFANGSISSRQFGLVWNVDTDFAYVPEGRLGSGSASRVDGSGRSGVGFDRMQAVFGVYRPRGGARRSSGGALSSSIGLVGARFETAVGRNLYAGVEAAGAASGGVAGYAEYLGTLGIESPLWGDGLHVGARVALGMGGGGDIDTGGGLLGKAGVYGIVRLGRGLGLTLEAGAARAPQGNFKALQASAALVWVFDDASAASPSTTTRTEWVGGVERYDAPRRDGSTRSLEAVALRVNRFVTPSVYVSGQAHSALGGGAGGYSVGLFGVGVQQPVATGWRLGAELLAGAAGGGGVSTEGGFIVQPMAYVHRDLVPGIGLRIAAGHVKGRHGPLSANVVDVSLAFTHGVLEHGGW